VHVRVCLIFPLTYLRFGVIISFLWPLFVFSAALCISGTTARCCTNSVDAQGGWPCMAGEAPYTGQFMGGAFLLFFLVGE
jgi:hypothetical protein